jgi:hypothetical protein
VHVGRERARGSKPKVFFGSANLFDCPAVSYSINPYHCCHSMVLCETLTALDLAAVKLKQVVVDGFGSDCRLRRFTKITLSLSTEPPSTSLFLMSHPSSLNITRFHLTSSPPSLLCPAPFLIIVRIHHSVASDTICSSFKMDDDGFNSSDELEGDDDWDRTQFARKATAGKRQTATIIARQAEDRVLSKRNWKAYTRIRSSWDPVCHGSC